MQKPGPIAMPCALRRSLALIAAYAFFCVGWIGFAQWIAPSIIAQAYEGRGLPILNWIFSDHGSNSVQHYLDRWAVLAGAVPLAAILHLTVVLLIERIRRKQVFES